MGELFVVMLSELCRRGTQGQMPSHAGVSPLLVPIQFGARTYEELHLHLLKFTHPKDKLTGDDLISKSLSDLGDSEGNLHSCSLLHIQKVHKNPLCSLRTQINGRGILRHRSHLGGKHQVELTDISPIGSAADRAFDAFVGDQVTDSVQIFCFEQTSQSCG